MQPPHIPGPQMPIGKKPTKQNKNSSVYRAFWQTLLLFLTLGLPPTVYSSPPARLAAIGLSGESTQEELISTLTAAVRDILRTPPANQAELDNRIERLTGYGFNKLKKYSTMTQPRDWITKAEWTDFQNFYNAIHQCGPDDHAISFEDLKLKLASGQSSQKSKEWQRLHKMFGKCQQFLNGETINIPEEDAYNFTGMRNTRTLTPKGIYDSQVIEYFPNLQESNELLRLWYNALLILWADVSTFVYIDECHPTPDVAPPLLDWRNLPPPQSRPPSPRTPAEKKPAKKHPHLWERQ